MPTLTAAIASLACAAAMAAAEGPSTEVRLGIDGGIVHADKLEITGAASSAGRVEARPLRLDLAVVRAPWGVGARGGAIVGADAYYGRSHGGAAGDVAAGISGATTVDTRSVGIGIDVGYAVPVAARLTLEGLLSESYLSESLRVQSTTNNGTKTAEDDFGAVGWETALKLALRYAVTPAFSAGVTARMILANRADAEFLGEEVRYRQRGIQFGVDVGYRF